jgi:hypothetical protein
MDSDKTILATFTQSAGGGPYTLDISVVGMGSVTKSPDKSFYNPGETVTLTAIPDTNGPNPAGYNLGDYILYNWHGNGVTGRSNPLIITINGNTIITANFAYVVNEVNGIYLYKSLDGLSNDPNVNPYQTPYFVHGPLLQDYPLFWIEGTSSTKPMGTGITLSNVVLDDDWYGSGLDRGQIFGIRGYPATLATTFLRGSGNSVEYCTLRNSIRYGFSLNQASNFYYGNNRVEHAQWGISGSGSICINGIIENNYVSNVWNAGFKSKGLRDVTFRNNYVDLTPYHPASANPPSPNGINFSDDVNTDQNVVVEDNVFVRLSAGESRLTIGLSVDAGHTGTGCKFINNLIVNPEHDVNVGEMRSAYLAGSNFEVSGNIFENCLLIQNVGSNNLISGNTFRSVTSIPQPPTDVGANVPDG